MSRLNLLLAVAALHVCSGVEYAAKIFPSQGGQCPSPEDRKMVRDQITAEVDVILYDLVNSCGGTSWQRVAYLNMTDPSQQCPSGLNLTSHSIRTCGSSHAIDNECSSTFFAVNGQAYNQVCGRIKAYQFGRVSAFNMRNEINQAIGDTYVNGVSLSRGDVGHRQHIWTFANGYAELNIFGFPVFLCPCDNSQSPDPPAFVGNNYFCEAGTFDDVRSILFSDDPLWDGEGCRLSNACCELNNPPWFTAILPTHAADDIELRICHTAPTFTQDFPIEQIELYVR